MNNSKPFLVVTIAKSIPFGYRTSWFMDMWCDSPSIGKDPKTMKNIYYGDGIFIACLLEDKPQETEKDDEHDIPF